MEYRLLGPLDVRESGRAVGIGGPRQRALLAILLLRANEVISVDELATELWHKRVPDTASNSLQAHVSRLRKALGPSRIQTQSPGYVLCLGDDQRDVERFETLVSQGRRALSSGDARRASESLRRGLALWRGPALADISLHGVTAAEVRRLEEERLAAVEERIDADLAVGRHTELVPELEALVGRHPLRERLRSQLMLALYRCGRQAESLELYRRTRKVLVDELGIEPSPGLQRLETAILLHDSSLDFLDTGAEPRFSGVEIVTRAAPRDVALVGREAELAHLRQAFESARARRTTHLVSVLGDPGIGKSRIAQELISDLRGEVLAVLGRCHAQGDGTAFWPLVEIVNQLAGDCTAEAIERLLEGEEQSRLVAARIAGALGAGNKGGEIEDTFWALRNLFEAVARRRPLAVVLDDVQWASETLFDFIDYVMDWSHEAPLLFLCLARPELLDKRPTWGGGKLNTSTLALEPLTRASVLALLELLPGGEALGNEDTARIADVAEGNPLFVEQMVALAGEHDDGELRIPPTINAIVTARLTNLRDDERDVVDRASVIGKQFWLGALLELMPTDRRSSAMSVLRRLVRKGLVRSDRSILVGEEGFRFHHGLIREVAYALLPIERRPALHERFADWLQWRSEEQTTNAEEIVGNHLEHAYRYKEQLGILEPADDDLALRAARALSAVREREVGNSGLRTRVDVLRRAESLLPRDDLLRAEILADIAGDLEQLGDFTAADGYYATAGEIARGASSRSVERYIQVRQLHCRLRHEAETTPSELLREGNLALAALLAAGEERYATVVKTILATTYVSRGHAELACNLLADVADKSGYGQDDRAFSVARRILVAAWLWGATPVSEAVEHCKLILSESPPARVEASTLRSLGVLKAMDGDFTAARQCLDDDREILARLGMSHALMGAQYFRAMIEIMAGNSDVAETVLRRAYQSLTEVGDTWYSGAVAVMLAELLHEKGSKQEVSDLLEFFDRVDSHEVTVSIRALGTRAKLLADKSQPDIAKRLAQDGVRTATATDHINDQADAYTRLAYVLRRAGEIPQGRCAAMEALRLYEVKGNRVDATRAAAQLKEISA